MENQIKQLMLDNPRLRPIEIAKELGCDELTVVKQLPEDEVAFISTDNTQAILTDIASWGNVTSIIEVSGFIFEVKAPFPLGKNAYGYYNLAHDSQGLQGHLKLENVAAIAKITRKVQGKLSYCLHFFDQQGSGIFKIYLGRDENGKVIETQIEKFHAL